LVRGALAGCDAGMAGVVAVPPKVGAAVLLVPVAEPAPMLLDPVPVVPVVASGVGVGGVDGAGVIGAGVVLLAGSPGLLRSQAVSARADTSTRGAATSQRDAVQGVLEEFMAHLLGIKVAANRRWSRHARERPVCGG